MLLSCLFNLTCADFHIFWCRLFRYLSNHICTPAMYSSFAHLQCIVRIFKSEYPSKFVPFLSWDSYRVPGKLTQHLLMSRVTSLPTHQQTQPDRIMNFDFSITFFKTKPYNELDRKIVRKLVHDIPHGTKRFKR